MIPTYHKGERCYGTGYSMMSRIEQLEAACNHSESMALGYAAQVEELEAKLSKAVAIAEDAIETMESDPFFPEEEARRLRNALAELKGEK